MVNGSKSRIVFDCIYEKIGRLRMDIFSQISNEIVAVNVVLSWVKVVCIVFTCYTYLLGICMFSL